MEITLIIMQFKTESFYGSSHCTLKFDSRNGSGKNERIKLSLLLVLLN